MQAGFEVGDLIGLRWRLTGFLGQGAFGQVFSVTDVSNLDLGDAAVKVLHSNTSPIERAEFLNEVKKIALMRHQNLVAYLDSGEYVGGDGSHRVYLVTELCNYSLADHLATQPDGRMSSEDVLRLVADLAAGLGHLHRRNLLHRDLKPANMLWAAPEWKLADFGLVRDLSATGHYHRGDAIKGTPLYMAPELFATEASSPAADIYALGVTVHETLTGSHLHAAGNDAAFIARPATTEPTFHPSLPPEWRHFVAQAVQRDPADRPRADQLVDIIARARNDPAIVQVTRSASPPTQPPSTTGREEPVAPPSPPGSFSVGEIGVPSPQAKPTLSGSGSPMRQPGSRRLLIGAGVVLAVLVLVASVVLAIRGSGTDTDSADRAANGDVLAGDVVDADSSDAAPSSTTSSLLSPEEQAADVILTAADRPSGFSHDPFSPNEEEFCAGVDNVRAAFPGVANKAAEFMGDGHIFIVQATVHTSVDNAHQAIEHANRLRTTCDDQPANSSADAQILSLTEQLDVVVPGADEVSATVVLAQGSTVTVELLTIYARAGEITVLSTGSHRATAEYNAQLMIARATGLPEPAKVEPDGPAGAFFGSTAAATMRSLVPQVEDELMPAVVAWIDSHSDADIDAVLDRACTSLRDASTPIEASEGIDTVQEGLEPELRGDLDGNEFAQLIGLGLVFYCPSEVERLGLG